MAEQKKLKVKMKPSMGKATPVKTMSSDNIPTRAAQTASGSGSNNLTPKTSATTSSKGKDLAIRRGSDAATVGNDARAIKANDALYKGTMGITTQLAYDLLNSPRIKQNRDDVTKRAIDRASKPKPKPADPIVDKIMSAKPEAIQKATPRVTAASTTPRTARPSPISSSYGTDEDITRQSAIDENEKYFRDRGVKPLSGSGAFKSGGAVKSSASSRADGVATKGRTKGRFC